MMRKTSLKVSKISARNGKSSKPAPISKVRRKKKIAPIKPIQPVEVAPVSMNHFQSPTYAPMGWQLPGQYGEDKLALLVRDPWWLFAYWEVTEDCQRRAREQLAKRNTSHDKTVLRVYDLTGTDFAAPSSFFDIELNVMANNWYIDVGRPDRSWGAELGLRGADGSFVALVRSNVVRTPRYGISDVLDEEWMLPEEISYKILGLSGGFSPSSLDVRKDMRRLLEKHLRKGVSSGSLPSARGTANPE